MPIAIDYLILAHYISVDQMGNPVVNGILDEVRIEAANPRRETVPFVFSVLAHVSGASPGEISIPSYWELGVTGTDIRLAANMPSLIRPANEQGTGFIYAQNAILPIEQAFNGSQLTVAVTIVNDRKHVAFPIVFLTGGE